jgi:HlyD family secretion protein
MSAPQAATLETATARYIPAGSPVYKGDLALFPGMTANCTIVTNQKQDALRVPSVALRFNPSAFLKGKEAPRTGAAAGAVQGGGQRQQGGGNAARGMVTRREDRVWVLENGKPKALAVTVGISDGQYTENSSPGAGEGLVVLTGVEDLAKKAQSTSPLGGPGGPPPGGGRR